MYRSQAHISNHRKAYTKVLFLRKAELRFFHFLEMVTGWLDADQNVPVRPGWYLHRRRSRLLKTGFFRQVRELKIQMKNSGSALYVSGESN